MSADSPRVPAAVVEAEVEAALVRPSTAKRPSQLPTGVWLALPNLTLLIVFFVIPLLTVVSLSFMPEGSFKLSASFTLENYQRAITAGYYKTFLLSLGIAALATAILLVVCYPVAYGLAKSFGRWAPLFTLFFVMPLFVSETVRLYGWSLFFLKGGILNGLLSVLGLPPLGMMYTLTAILVGLVNIYLPFMLFPLMLGIALVDDDLVAAARDMGCNRFQAFRMVELPLSMPGVVIGLFLSFVMTLGSMSESKILGGRTIVMIADDIELAFGYQQNWPLGSALSVVLVAVCGGILIWLFGRVDLDRLLRGDDP
jgi:spermidine/putrescine transport system permease protein